MSKLCPNCGNVYEDNITKCSNCGTDLPLVQEEIKPIEDVITVNPIPVIEINEGSSVEPEPTNEVVSVVEIPGVVEAVTTPPVEETVVEPVQEVDAEQVVEELPKVEVETPIVEVETNPVVEEVAAPIVENVEASPIVQEVVETVQEVPQEVQTTIEEIKEVVPEQVEELPKVEVETTPVVEETPSIETVQEVVEQPVVFSEPVVEELPKVEIEQVQEVVEEQPVVFTEPAVEELPKVEVETPIVEVETTPVVEEETAPIVENVEASPIVQEVVETVQEVPQEVQTTVEEIKEVVPEQVVEELPKEVIDTPVVEAETTPVVEDKPKAIIDANTIIDVPEGIEEVSIENLVNEDLESVSVEVQNEDVAPVETVVEKVELPEATVGEIDASVLSSMYEQAEQQNESNKTMLQKQEEERIAREAAEKELAKRAEPKPDLMARVDYVVSDEPAPGFTPTPRRRKKSSFLPKFFIILFVMLVGAGLYWYFFVRDTKPKEETPETVISDYYNAVEKKDKSAILNTYVPCTRKDENVVNEIDVSIAILKQYSSFKFDYKINNTEVVNEEDRNNLKTNAIGTYCGVENVPDITDYKHVFVEQTLVTDERTTNDVEFWVVKIDNHWYIIPITENL